VATATTPPTLAEPTAGPTSTAGSQTYTVQEGDTLFSIAASFGLTVEQLAQANNISDPSSIFAGQVLVIPGGGATAVPTTAGQRTYTVQEGDNCFRIALNFGLTCEQLAAANGLEPPDYSVYPGQVLVIP
jgi:LysM repeat protein